MSMYKAFLKLLSRERVSILVSLTVFIASFGLFISLSPEENGQFEMVDMDLAVIDESNSELSKHFLDYLGTDNTLTISEKDEEVNLRQLMYVNVYDAIIKVPADFEEQLFKGADEVLEIESNLQPAVEQLSHTLVNKYLLYADAIHSTHPELSFGDFQTRMDATLETATSVNVLSEEQVTGIATYEPSIVFLAWFIMQISLSILGAVMISMRDEQVTRRIELGGVPSYKVNIQVFLGQLTFGVILLGITLAVLRVFIPQEIAFDWIKYGVTIALYIFSCIGLSFLLTQVFQNQYMYQAVTLITTLGLSFVSGIFVPYELMGETMQRLSSFSPMYYYAISVTDAINNYSELLVNWGILFAFGLVFILVGLVFTRQKQAQKR